jgi:hypothetical protein
MEKLDSGVVDVRRRAYQIDKREAKGNMSMTDKWALMRNTEPGAYPFTLETAPATPEIGGQS